MKLSIAAKLLIATASGFVVLAVVLVYLVSSTTERMMRAQAESIAETTYARVRAMRSMYTQHVVGRLQRAFPGQVKASAQFDLQEGEIPLPAVLVRLVGETTDQLSQNRLASYDLISGWNINREKGLTDPFEQEGWNYLLAQQEELRRSAGDSLEVYREKLKAHVWKPFVREERVGDRRMLRYLAADPAADASCVTCHNQLESTPETVAYRKDQGLAGADGRPKQFERHELMGALSVSVPLDEAGLSAAQGRRTILTVFFILGALILAVVFLLLRRWTRDIQELTRLTGKVASEGDLTVPVSIKSQDEVGQLATAFSTLMDNMREVLVNVNISGELVETSVKSLNASAAEQNQTISRQATALQETQVTAQEIKQTSTVAADKATVALEYVQRAEEVSTKGEAAVQQSLAAFADIQTRVEEIARYIGRLNERTTQIGEITQSVKDIADQSNMLALNAAIEAVRSGEHGKGFAVVAREIRSMADQSIQATNRVREILGEVDKAIRAAVSITEAGSHQIEAGLLQMKTSGDTINELATMVRENAAAVRQIAAAVGQQAAGVSQIFVAVTDQSALMDSSIKGVQSTEHAAAELEKVFRELIKDVKRFKV